MKNGDLMNDVVQTGRYVPGYRVDLIDPSPFQQRTHFDESAMEDLTASVGQHGVIQPLVCRYPGVVSAAGLAGMSEEGRLELVAGERRWRACQRAGLEVVPVLIRVLADVEAEEIVLIENLQREDLTPIEEARSFQRLKELEDVDGRPRYSDESLAERLGVKLSHVRRALQLLRCPEPLQSAVEAGEVAPTTAALVGSIHSEARRAEAARMILTPTDQAVPLNFKQTQKLIEKEFLVRVRKGCGFDPKDGSLVPVVLDPATGARDHGGSCVDCPHRSGNCEEIREDLAAAGGSREGGSRKGIDPNLCTRPSCFERKLEAQWKRVKVVARERGQAIVEGAEARKVFAGHHGEIAYDSRYADLAVPPKWEDFGEYREEPWGEIVSGIAGVEVMVARHPDTGRVHELVIRKDAVAAVKAAAPGKAERDRLEAREKEARKAKKAEEKLEVEAARELMSGIMDRAAAMYGGNVVMWSRLFALALRESGSEGALWIAKFLEVPAPSKGAQGRDYLPGILDHAAERAGSDESVWFGYVVMALLAPGAKWGGVNAEGMVEWARLCGVSAEAARKRAARGAGRPDGKKQKAGEAEPEDVVRPDGRDCNGHHVMNSAGVYAEAEKVRVALSLDPTVECVIYLAEGPDGWRGGWRAVVGDAERDERPRREDSPLLTREAALRESLTVAGAWLIGQQAPDEVLGQVEAALAAIGDGGGADGAQARKAEEAVKTAVQVLEAPEGADEEVVRANAEYERRRNELGLPVTMAAVEDECGLKRGRLANYRSNAKKLAKRAG